MACGRLFQLVNEVRAGFHSLVQRCDIAAQVGGDLVRLEQLLVALGEGSRKRVDVLFQARNPMRTLTQLRFELLDARRGGTKLFLRALSKRLLRVDINDQIVTDRVINELMGKDPSARFRFIMDRAEEAEELDV